MKPSDRELVGSLRALGNAMDKMPNGCGRPVAERLCAAAGRIVQLAQERHDITHLWYKCQEMCDICAHRCSNVEAESCEECDMECLCPTCEGENWEEARSDG